MKLLSFRSQSHTYVGVLQDNKVMNLTNLHDLYQHKVASCSAVPDTLETLIQHHDTMIPYIKELMEYHKNHGTNDIKTTFSLSEVEIISPVSQPEKIICVGLNYLDHCKETEMDPPPTPVIFSKYANAIIGDNDPIELPINSNQVDFEAELVVVIGNKAKCVTEETADEYIFGYTIMNDVSARDLQFADNQWTRGKSPDTFAPIGPYIITKDEVEDPHNLDISLTLNGKVMQKSNTKNLIFTIPYIISYLSQSMTLKPGDLIATGTPPGVGMGRTPQVWLKEGDELSITIENVGTLNNSVKKHPSYVNSTASKQ
ncbi:fumarylacetoacetate hydrolase family protein [Priestia endophytica]|uniref:fumarylacetoacetate hydrolase family protein n=1 Tax=Priestia filamentosa TaxID=1402861 RepID=UPI002E1EFE78|nr:fumarylacetoacetate hydrolase family protein [Priestia filamentosa]